MFGLVEWHLSNIHRARHRAGERERRERGEKRERERERVDVLGRGKEWASSTAEGLFGERKGLPSRRGQGGRGRRVVLSGRTG